MKQFNQRLLSPRRNPTKRFLFFLFKVFNNQICPSTYRSIREMQEEIRWWCPWKFSFLFNQSISIDRGIWHQSTGGPCPIVDVMSMNTNSNWHDHRGRSNNDALLFSSWHANLSSELLFFVFFIIIIVVCIRWKREREREREWVLINTPSRMSNLFFFSPSLSLFSLRFSFSSICLFEFRFCLFLSLSFSRYIRHCFGSSRFHIIISDSTRRKTLSNIPKKECYVLRQASVHWLKRRWINERRISFIIDLV